MSNITEIKFEEFRKGVRALVNRLGIDADFNVADIHLADYLTQCLQDCKSQIRITIREMFQSKIRR